MRKLPIFQGLEALLFFHKITLTLIAFKVVRKNTKHRLDGIFVYV